MSVNTLEVRQFLCNAPWDAVEEAIHEQGLVFNTRSLVDIGFDPCDEIGSAVERAMQVCNYNGLRLNDHFKPIYVSDNDTHTVRKEWKLSRLAYMLVMLNGASDNPMAGRLQYEVLKVYMQKTDED
ncbi:hypothetical protein ACFQ21_17640 [Ohtaekwangia kribbensis]|jgi:hypothetical protein|uniref:Uncharacterized protein n=1 Tax=Ohtaekwangia kribbensis TaxID=688913 RepID=A0ABW3K4H6_9BACT